MAARSVTVNFVNNSDVALIRDSGSLSHGIWTVQPPGRIEVGTTVSWESESSGVLTGTEGEVTYKIETGPGQTDGSAHFHWDDPFVGSNSYDEAVPVGYKSDRSGGDGDNATVNWTFDCSSATCDGIPDDWKINGVTIDPGDGSGPQFINLPAMGATVNKPDIFVQLDFMADGTHSHALTPAAIKTVVTAFANSPFKSRTGSIAINLHVDAGPNSIMNFATNQTWGALSRARQLPEVTNLGTATFDSKGNLTSYNWTAFDAIKNALGGFKSTGRTAIFRYAISAHQISTASNSGVARAIPGSDFIVSLAKIGLPPTTNQEAGTFMHELGHNLGLQHGGGDGVNNKPNYISVMNYSFQFPGLTRGGIANIYDYSNVALNTLDETNLDETTGVGAAASGVATSHWLPPAGGNPGAFVAVADASKPIDWNGNGVLTDKNFAFDVNGDAALSPPPPTTLTPFDDWKNLKLKGGSIGAGGEAQQPMVSTVIEMTPEDIKLVLPVDLAPPTTTAVVTPAPNAAGWNRTDVTVTLTATDDISGVARTEYDLDGAGSSVVTGPIPITTEGIHTLQFHSIDRSQNVESTKQIVVSIDKTPPEAVITYDPKAHEIVVTGRDALSGVNPGSIPPVSVTPENWTDFGSDAAEKRTYLISDRADNALALTMKVKCEDDEYEFSVTDLRYNHDQKHDKPQRNTIEFERVVGRGLDHPLLAVEQEVSLGEGDARSTVEATYDVLHDESEIEYLTGGYKSTTNVGEGQKDQGQQSGHDIGGKNKSSEQQDDDPEQRGLILLRIVTDKGRLKLEE
jgi:hypothetical protein